jgi:hypothetical protein
MGIRRLLDDTSAVRTVIAMARWCGMSFGVLEKCIINFPSACCYSQSQFCWEVGYPLELTKVSLRMYVAYTPQCWVAFRACCRLCPLFLQMQSTGLYPHIQHFQHLKPSTGCCCLNAPCHPWTRRPRSFAKAPGLNRNSPTSRLDGVDAKRKEK